MLFKKYFLHHLGPCQKSNQNCELGLHPISYRVLITGKSFVQGSSTCVMLTFSFHGSEKHFLYDTGTSYDREKLLTELKKCHLKTDDIDCVILSHWHIDHIGNADLFPNALIVTSAETFDVIQHIQKIQRSNENAGNEISKYYTNLLKLASLSYTPSKIRAMTTLTQKHQNQFRFVVDAYAAHKVVLITDKTACFDNLICLYKLHSHTYGDIVIKILCDDRAILLTGDYIIDKVDYSHHLDRLQQFDMHSHDLIIPGHDSYFSVETSSSEILV